MKFEALSSPAAGLGSVHQLWDTQFQHPDFACMLDRLKEGLPLVHWKCLIYSPSGKQYGNLEKEEFLGRGTNEPSCTWECTIKLHWNEARTCWESVLTIQAAAMVSLVKRAWQTKRKTNLGSLSKSPDPSVNSSFNDSMGFYPLFSQPLVPQHSAVPGSLFNTINAGNWSHLLCCLDFMMLSFLQQLVSAALLSL